MISNRSDEDVGIFEGGEYCEEVRWKESCIHRDLGCGIFCFYSVVSLVLFLGGVISMKILDAGLSCFCCSIGSVSGRSHIHEDIGCGVFTLLLFHWFCFWEKGLEIRAVHFGAARLSLSG
jgi:hypothetical protein